MANDKGQEKRICFVNTSKTWGGGEKWHYDVAARLHEQGKQVYAICHPEGPLAERLRAYGVPVYALPITNWSIVNPLRLWRIRRMLVFIAPQVVVLNLSNDVKTVGLIARMLRAPRIIYRRGSAIPIRNSLFNRFMLKRILTDVLANSQATRLTINQNNVHMFDEGRIRVVYNGLKLRELDDTEATTFFNESRNSLVHIGNLGRLSAEKAQHYLLDFGERLKASGRPFKIIIGGEGEQRPFLEAQAREKGLYPYLEMPGFIRNIPTFMQDIDIFVLTSLWEGFGYVMAEAMYFKKPVVAFNTSSTPEIVVDGKTGLLANYGDADDMYRKIVYLLDHPEERMEMGKRGRREVLRRFDFDKNFAELYRFLYDE